MDNSDKILRLLNMIKRHATDIRNDWVDPRWECGQVNEMERAEKTEIQLRSLEELCDEARRISLTFLSQLKESALAGKERKD